MAVRSAKAEVEGLAIELEISNYTPYNAVMAKTRLFWSMNLTKDCRNLSLFETVSEIDLLVAIVFQLRC